MANDKLRHAIAFEGARLMYERVESEYYAAKRQVLKHGEAHDSNPVNVHDHFPFELAVYPEDKAHYVFKRSITGKPSERASIRELEQLLESEYPDLNVEEELWNEEADT